MRLCFYSDSFLPQVGGAEMVLHHLATHLTHRQQHVMVFAPHARGPGICEPIPYPIYRYRKPSSKRFGVRQLLLPLAWLYWRHRFQVLHCHASYPAAYVGATFKRLFGVPLVIRPHGFDVLPGERIRRHPRLERRLRRALAAADMVIAQGRFLQEHILALGVPAHRIQVIHNGVDLAAFTATAPTDHSRPYILSMGNLTYHKGFDILLRAYARLQPPVPELRLAGTGRERLALQTLAQQLGIAERVHFLGFLQGQEKIEVFRAAMVFVCPSRREPFANVILEALAAGVPVVASAVGGNLELIRDGQHGALFAAEDDAALAQVLRHVLQHSQLLAAWRRAIPEFVRDFDWPVVANRYLALYQRLAGVGESIAP